MRSSTEYLRNDHLSYRKAVEEWAASVGPVVVCDVGQHHALAKQTNSDASNDSRMACGSTHRKLKPTWMRQFCQTRVLPSKAKETPSGCVMSMGLSP